MLVHQIGRSAEMSDDKEPQLKDLRWSADLEQRADMVWLGYRQDMYKGMAPGQTSVPFQVNVAKNRQGSAGNQQKVILDYDLQKQTFS